MMLERSAVALVGKYSNGCSVLFNVIVRERTTDDGSSHTANVLVVGKNKQSGNRADNRSACCFLALPSP